MQFDDDEVSNIAPGSTIMYLVYGVANLDDGGATTNCMTFEQHRAVFDAAVTCIFEEGARAAGDHCDYDSWSTSIQSLIPHAYTFSAGASDTSADGATAMAMRFGDDWTQFIYHACVTGGSYDANAVTCEHSNAAGNCIYDGGSDMCKSTRNLPVACDLQLFAADRLLEIADDIGNLIMTSLMNSRGPNDELPWNQYGGVPAPECDLGAISYENNFDPIATTCFVSPTDDLPPPFRNAR